MVILLVRRQLVVSFSRVIGGISWLFIIALNGITGIAGCVGSIIDLVIGGVSCCSFLLGSLLLVAFCLFLLELLKLTSLVRPVATQYVLTYPLLGCSKFLGLFFVFVSHDGAIGCFCGRYELTRRRDGIGKVAAGLSHLNVRDLSLRWGLVRHDGLVIDDGHGC